MSLKKHWRDLSLVARRPKSIRRRPTSRGLSGRSRSRPAHREPFTASNKQVRARRIAGRGVDDLDAVIERGDIEGVRRLVPGVAAGIGAGEHRRRSLVAARGPARAAGRGVDDRDAGSPPSTLPRPVLGDEQRVGGLVDGEPVRPTGNAQGDRLRAAARRIRGVAGRDQCQPPRACVPKRAF